LNLNCAVCICGGFLAPQIAKIHYINSLGITDSCCCLAGVVIMISDEGLCGVCMLEEAVVW
jgi:hypothetical protein